MSSLNAANVTKYDAGGSGDNIISDGYIKSVEKVWIDSYALTAGLSTATSICIGIVPANAKITEVVVYMPALYVLDTLGTIYVQTGATVGAAGYYGTMKADGYQTTTYNPGTAWTLRLGGLQHKTLSAAQKVYITLVTDGDASTTLTGTVRSIIRYT